MYEHVFMCVCVCVCECVCEGGGTEHKVRGVTKRRAHGGEIQVRNSEISTVQEARWS